MSCANTILQIESVWKAALADFNLADQNIKLPAFPQNLLYGVVSEKIHNPDISKVYVSDLSSDEYKYFYKIFGPMFNFPYDEFQEYLTEINADEFN